MSDPALHLKLPARTENVIVVRQAIAGLGEALGLVPQRVNDLKTVVSEACNNVVLHAYGDEPGPLEVIADSDGEVVGVTVRDRGTGFQPSADATEGSLGLGLPLIASLSDEFQIGGRPGEGTETRVSFDLARDEPGAARNGTTPPEPPETLAMEMVAGTIVRPVLARVIGALAARAQLPVDRLSESMLLGDAVAAHEATDFSTGRVTLSIRDDEGSLGVRVGPLVDGGGKRILSEMDLPGGEGSLRELASSVAVSRDQTPDGGEAEFLLIEVSP